MGQAHKEYDGAKHLDIVDINPYNFCNLFSSILIFFVSHPSYFDFIPPFPVIIL